jgi:hypothetical protein
VDPDPVRYETLSHPKKERKKLQIFQKELYVLSEVLEASPEVWGSS